MRLANMSPFHQAFPFWAVAFLGLMLLSAFLSFLWTPYEIEMVNLAHRLQPPNQHHWLGTDHFGRDMLSLMMVGVKDSLLIACFSVGLGAIIAIPLGMICAYFSGMFSWIVDRSSDLIFAFPALLSAILLTAIYGPNRLNVILSIAIYTLPIFFRLARAASQRVMAEEFVMAAKALGTPARSIIWRHILPNIMGLLWVQIAIQCAIAILIEAGISFLGFGQPSPGLSWGRMLADAQSYLYQAPHTVIIPGVFIMGCVISFNHIAEYLRHDHTL